MTETEALEYIYSRQKFAKSSSFERLKALLNALDNPQNKLSFVHIAGTNGKGSCCTMLSSCLVSSGYKTGLFISPFVVCFRERIQVNGKYISEKSFCEITQRVKDASDALFENGITPTFFETCLAIALLYYEKEKCDIVILEAGIGGKEDSTNIIPPPLVSVITSVSFDHTEVLGSTLYEIAKHKSGIIKKGSSCVSFPKDNGKLDFVPQQSETVKALEEKAAKEKVELSFPDVTAVKILEKSSRKTRFFYNGTEYEMSFTGDHQIGNAATVLCVLNKLLEKGFSFCEKSIKEGFKNAFIPGRLEVIRENPLVIIDGGHNEGCMKALKSYVKENLKENKITAVLGFMKDKDYNSSIKIIAPVCKNIVFTLCDKSRGEDPQVLMECAKPYCKNLFFENDIEKAYLKAKALTDEKDALICAGSFYLISEIREKFL